MSKKLFSLEEINVLKQNLFVKSVSSKGITYTEEFKNNFIADYENGQLPTEIFIAHGFDIELLGKERIKSAAARWKKSFHMSGASGLSDSRSTNSGRPRTKELTAEEELKRVKAELELVKAENELLKKLRLMRKMLE